MVSQGTRLHQAERKISNSNMYMYILKYMSRGHIQIFSIFLNRKLIIGLTAMHFIMVLKLEPLDITVHGNYLSMYGQGCLVDVHMQELTT
jgi:hypothetical protein